VEKPVRDRAVVRDREIFHMEACLPGARLDVRGTTRDSHRPEESALAKSWVKVVYLVREVRSRRPLEDVESDEPEGGMLMAAGKVDVLALHDSHVGIEGEVAKLALANTGCVSCRHKAVEIEDGGLIACARQVDMEVAARHVDAAWDGPGST